MIMRELHNMFKMDYTPTLLIEKNPNLETPVNRLILKSPVLQYSMSGDLWPDMCCHQCGLRGIQQLIDWQERRLKHSAARARKREHQKKTAVQQLKTKWIAKEDCAHRNKDEVLHSDGSDHRCDISGCRWVWINFNICSSLFKAKVFADKWAAILAIVVRTNNSVSA